MVSLGALLAPLNSTMLAVALPTIRSDFGLANGTVAWLISSYLIAMAVVQPVAGRLGDELGRLRVFRYALILFLVFSLAALVAPTFSLLVTFRIFQAVSGAVLIPNGIGMLRAAVPADRFGTYSGFNSAVIGTTAALGPLLGAAIIVVAPWRMLFLANVPFVLAALLLTARISLPDTNSMPRSKVEPIGLILFAGLLVAATASFNSIRSDDSSAAVSIGVATVAVAVAFAAHQRKATSPVAAWSLFRVRSFVGASTHILLMNLVMYTTLLAIPFFITDVQGRSATVAGLLLGAMAALQALSAPLSGRVSDWLGRRRPALFSSTIALTAALLLVFGVGADTPFWYLAASVTILGLGVGVGFVTAGAAAVESVGLERSGSAAGTQSMMRYVGSIIGTGVLTGMFATGGATGDIGTFRTLFIVVASIAALSLVAATLIRPFAAAGGTARNVSERT
jgi:EmrB/QacA subfamily drug resistance transporter